MPRTVPITVIGRTFEITCDEGQENDVQSLARQVDNRANALMRSVGQAGDTRLLVMVALSFADELAEARRTGVIAAAPSDTDASLADSIDALAGRIDAIAARLQNA
jgi:cell division protein ZapA